MVASERLVYSVVKEIDLPPRITTTPEPWENVVFATELLSEAERLACGISNERAGVVFHSDFRKKPRVYKLNNSSFDITL